MGAAVVGSMEWLFASKLIAVVLVRAILVNVVLGSLEVRDDDGTVLHALDE